MLNNRGDGIMSHKKKHKALKHKLKQQQYESKINKELDGVEKSKDIEVKESEPTPLPQPVKKEQGSSLIIDLPDEPTSALQFKQAASISEPLPESNQSSLEAELPSTDKVVSKTQQTSRVIQAFVTVVGMILVIIGIYFMVQIYNDTKESVESPQTQEQVSEWEELYNEVEQESIRQDLTKETHVEEELVDIDG